MSLSSTNTHLVALLSRQCNQFLFSVWITLIEYSKIRIVFSFEADRRAVKTQESSCIIQSARRRQICVGAAAATAAVAAAADSCCAIPRDFCTKATLRGATAPARIPGIRNSRAARARRAERTKPATIIRRAYRSAL